MSATSERRARRRAQIVVRKLEPHLDAYQAAALERWGRQLLELSDASSRPLYKAREALQITARTLRESRLLPAVWTAARDLAWADRSWAARLGLSAAAVTAATASGKGAGIAALGGAIGVPLWVVFGAGGTFVGTLVDELQRVLEGDPVAVATDGLPDGEVLDAEWSFDSELGAPSDFRLLLEGGALEQELLADGDESLWKRFRELQELGRGRVDTMAGRGRAAVASTREGVTELLGRARGTLNRARRVRTTRYIAVDWSGHATASSKFIYMGEAGDGELLRLESGRDRQAVVEYLAALAGETNDLVVGLDFAFSLPAWFLWERGLRSAFELWSLVGREGEDWLANPEWPFWSVSRGHSPWSRDGYSTLRRTEDDAAGLGPIAPKSAFQVTGPGAVGTASLRGMPFLTDLRDRGFSIWPFDPPELPLVVEIYPRLFAKAVRKNDESARRDFLRRRFGELDGELFGVAASSEHAFDAAVSALAMQREGAGLFELPDLRSTVYALEGAIWESRLVSGYGTATAVAQA